MSPALVKKKFIVKFGENKMSNKVRRLEKRIAKLEKRQFAINERYNLKIENLYLEKNYFENLEGLTEDWREYEISEEEK